MNKKVFCGYCGSEIYLENNYCIKCGKKIKNNVKRSKYFKIIAKSVLAVLLFGIILIRIVWIKDQSGYYSGYKWGETKISEINAIEKKDVTETDQNRLETQSLKHIFKKLVVLKKEYDFDDYGTLIGVNVKTSCLEASTMKVYDYYMIKFCVLYGKPYYYKNDRSYNWKTSDSIISLKKSLFQYEIEYRVR
ncbi:MAG: hypothetical protein K5851_06810 [Lachnospiraceae bacterium]|nr:hypothetical protein [Lachnospiraceae bacterium]